MEKDEKSRVDAWIGRDAQRRLGLPYAHDLRSIADALLQGAARSAANTVEVSIDGALGMVTVSHDGCGLPHGDVPTMLEFGPFDGDPHWARGPGPDLLPLLRVGATIRSQDWRLVVPVGMIDGMPAELVRYGGGSKRSGTVVEFRWKGAEDPEERRDIAATFRRAAAAMAFVTIVDGRTVERYNPIDQLGSPDGIRRWQEKSTSVGAWRVTVARYENGRDRWRNPPRHEALEQNWLTLACEAGGRVIRPGAAEIAALHPALATPAEGRLLTVWDDRHVAVEPGYVAVIEAAEDRSRGSRDLADMLGEDLGPIIDALADAIAALIAEAPRNAIADGHPMRRFAHDAGHPIPPRQLTGVQPRRRDRNASSGTSRPRIVTGPERGALIVIDNGRLVHREPDLPAEATRLPPFGPVFSELLVATTSTRPRLVERLIEAVTPLPELDVVVAATLEVDGRRHVIAEGEAFDDAAVAAAWTACGLPRRIVPVRTLDLVLERLYGPPLRAPLGHACIEIAPGVVAVLAARRDIGAIGSSLSKVIDWRRTGDAQKDLAAFRRAMVRRMERALPQRDGRGL